MSSPPTMRAEGTLASRFRFDARRWTWSDRIVGVATLVLFVSLFMPWFGVSATFFDTPVEDSVNGLWHGYMYIDLILALAVIVYLIARAGFATLPFGLSSQTGKFLLTAAAGLNLLLALISFLTKPSVSFADIETSWQYGAYLGLIAAVVAAAVPIGAIVAAAVRARTEAQHARTQVHR